MKKPEAELPGPLNKNVSREVKKKDLAQVGL